MGAGRAAAPSKDGARRVIPAGGVAYWLSVALAVIAALSALLTYLAGDVLRGPAVMNGSARGTALVVLVVGVPVLAGSLVRYFFLQPVIAALGIVQLALVRRWQRAGSAAPPQRQHRPVLHA